jgi:nicotinic acid phosphoribosyltransferase
VGTKLITAYDQPALGAVYKIVSIEDENGNMRDTIKLSSNAEKVSTPGKKQVWRITSKEKGKSEGDYITFADTDVTHLDSIYMFHPTTPTSIKPLKTLKHVHFSFLFLRMANKFTSCQVCRNSRLRQPGN